MCVGAGHHAAGAGGVIFAGYFAVMLAISGNFLRLFLVRELRGTAAGLEPKAGQGTTARQVSGATGDARTRQSALCRATDICTYETAVVAIPYFSCNCPSAVHLGDRNSPAAETAGAATIKKKYMTPRPFCWDSAGPLDLAHPALPHFAHSLPRIFHQWQHQSSSI